MPSSSPPPRPSPDPPPPQHPLARSLFESCMEFRKAQPDWAPHLLRPALIKMTDSVIACLAELYKQIERYSDVAGKRYNIAAAP